MPIWTFIARNDLESQLEYIRKENPDIVGRIAAQIKSAAGSLDSFPQLGRDGSVGGTKELVIPKLPFIVVYRIRDGRVEVLRFLHERMNWPK